MSSLPPIEFGFPLGIRLTHAFNIVFLTLLIRSGIEILGGQAVASLNRSTARVNTMSRGSRRRTSQYPSW
jgi:hypothetical protein